MEVRMIDEKNKFFEYGYSWEKEVQSRGYYAYPANDKGVVITKFNEDDYYSQFHTKKVVVPNKLNGLPVTGVGVNCFSRNHMEEIVLPNSVLTIGIQAFSTAQNLRSVDLGSSLVRIEGAAFEFCSALERIELPSSLVRIDDCAFENTGLRSIEFPEGLRKIGVVAFSGCAKLERVIIPASVRHIGGGAFAGAPATLDISPQNPYYASVADMLITKDGKKLISYPGGVCYRDIPEGIEEIDDFAFDVFNDYPIPKFPKSVKDVGAYFF